MSLHIFNCFLANDRSVHLPVNHLFHSCGNGFGRVVLRVSDATALSAQLVAAGYQPGEAHANSVNHIKVFWVSDPDGYKYEIAEVPANQ